VRDPINLFTGVLAIFTIILAAASIYQGWQTQQSVEISKRALTDLERPYLFILDYNWLLTVPLRLVALNLDWFIPKRMTENFRPLSKASNVESKWVARPRPTWMMSPGP
jgi:hypothetical protein